MVSVLVINNKQKLADHTEIVIGAPLALSGTAVTDGSNIKKGIELAKEDLLKRGIKVGIVYEDDGTDPKKTVSAVNKLIAFDKVQAIIGPTWSFLLDSAGPILNENKITSYSPANTSEYINTKSPYIFFGAVKNYRLLSPTAEWLRVQKSKRVAIIVDKSAWGESILVPFDAAAIQAGADVVLIDRITFGTEKESIPTILAKIKLLGVDTILWTGYDEGTATIIRRIQELKLNVSFLSASTIAYGLSKKGDIQINPKDEMYFLRTNMSKTFSEKFYKKYGEYPGTYSDSAYDGLMILVEAIKNKKEGQTTADYLRNDTNYHGFQTDYQFDESGDIKGGEWIVEKLK